MDVWETILLLAENRVTFSRAHFWLSAGVEQWERLSSMGSLQRLMDKPLYSHRPVLCKLMRLCKRHHRDIDVNNTRGEAPWIHAGKNTTQPEASMRHLQCWVIQQAESKHFTVQLYRTSQRRQFGQEHASAPENNRGGDFTALQANPKLNQTQWANPDSNQLVPKAFYSKDCTPGRYTRSRVHRQ